MKGLILRHEGADFATRERQKTPKIMALEFRTSDSLMIYNIFMVWTTMEGGLQNRPLSINARHISAVMQQ
jgi:hypothetical protein